MMTRVSLPGIGTVEVYPRPNHDTIALEIGARTPGVRLVSLELMPEHVIELAQALEAVGMAVLKTRAEADLADEEAIAEAEARVLDGNR